MHVIIFIVMRQAPPISTTAMECVLEREDIAAVCEVEGDDIAVARALRTGADFRTAASCVAIFCAHNLR